MTWPPRWAPGPHFKGSATTKVERVEKKQKADAKEDKNKSAVRTRDKRCRFPLCGCKALGLRMEVSHRKHKGIGGNPAGDRSTPEGMIYLCVARHKDNLVSIDRGTLRWEALDSAEGANGPVRWLVDLMAMQGLSGSKAQWFEIAVEKDLHWHERLTKRQAALLAQLREMKL